MSFCPSADDVIAYVRVTLHVYTCHCVQLNKTWEPVLIMILSMVEQQYNIHTAQPVPVYICDRAPTYNVPYSRLMSSYVVEGPLGSLKLPGPGATATSAPTLAKPLHNCYIQPPIVAVLSIHR